tara:strand:+ start:54 stop:545 length:492 start_codon:yes stop_codon:yes gene_type:complete
MIVSEQKIRTLIREQLLLEFSLAYFVARNSIALTKLIFAENVEEMKPHIDSIRKYYSEGDKGCKEMHADIQEILKDTELIDSIINTGVGLVMRAKPELVNSQEFKSDEFDELFKYVFGSCGPEVGESFKKLIYKLVSSFANNPKFKDAALTQDFKTNKLDYLA